jgi:hypothetical protein
MEETKTDKKAEERKDTRFERRLKKRMQDELDKLVIRYFTERSAILDPNGEEAADLFSRFRAVWVGKCAAHNKTRSPLKMNYEAFNSSVDFFLREEEKNIKMTQIANKGKDFPHWLRRRKVWRTMPLTSIYFWIKSLGNKEKILSLWRKVYLETIKP